jgi:hypothetical protein
MWEVDGKWCSHEDRAQTEGEGTRSISQSLWSAPPGLRNEGHVEAYLQSRLEERVAGVGGLAPPDGEQLFKEAVAKSRKSLGSRGAPPRDVPDSAARIRRMIASLKEELKDMKTGDPRADDVKEQLAALFNQEKEIVHGAKRADEVIEAANRKIFQLRKSLEEDNLSDSAKESVLRHIQGIEKSTKANLDYIDSHTNRDVNGASRRTTANTIDAEVLRKEREEEADEINTLGKSTRIGTRRKGAATYTMSKSKSKEL